MFLCSESVSEAQLHIGAAPEALDGGRGARLRHLLLEADGACQQVGQLEAYMSMLGRGILRVEVEHVDGLLLHVAQAGYAHGVDARALQIVEQRHGQSRAVGERGVPGDVGVAEVGRRSLKRALVVGVRSALGQLDVGVHERCVEAGLPLCREFSASFELDAGGAAVVGVVERVDGRAAREPLYAFDGVVQQLAVGRGRQQVAGVGDAFEAQVDVVVVAVVEVEDCYAENRAVCICAAPYDS